jgi:hypothetical protein
MTPEERLHFTCPQCGLHVTTDEQTPAWGVSKWSCPQGHWDGPFPCSPTGHEESDRPTEKGKCKFCLWPVGDSDDEDVD